MRALHVLSFASLMALYLLACDYAGMGQPWVSALRLVNTLVMQLSPS